MTSTVLGRYVGGAVALVGPAHGAEGHERGRVPGIEHVFIAAQRLAWGLGLGFGFVAGHDHVAVFVVPRRDLVAPPQLAADAPVLDVVHPLVVGVDPVLGHKGHFARGHRVDGLLRNALAGGVAFAHLAHGHEPLVGQHGLDHLACAGADRHHELVLLHLDQRAEGFEVGHHGLAGHEAVHALVLGRGVLVDSGLQRQHHDHRQLVALAHGVVVLVVRGGDLHHARAEFLVHVVVGDHRDLAVAQRQVDHLADEVRVACILRVHHQRHVAQHGFRAGGGHRQAARSIGQRVGDVPQRAVFFFALDFQVGHCGLQLGVPVHQALAAVDQALLVQLHEGVGDHLGELVVHGEVFTAPVHAVAHAAHLRGDGVAGLFLPLPNLAHKVLARLGRGGAHVVAADALFLQLALHHDLRGDARVVGARHPHRVETAHAVVAREAVHDRLVERMAHVQRARHIGGRQLDGEGGLARLRSARATVACGAVSALFPFGAPVGFQRSGFKGLGQAFEAGLLQGRAHGWVCSAGGNRWGASTDKKVSRAF